MDRLSTIGFVSAFASVTGVFVRVLGISEEPWTNVIAIGGMFGFMATVIYAVRDIAKVPSLEEAVDRLTKTVERFSKEEHYAHRTAELMLIHARAAAAADSHFVRAASGALIGLVENYIPDVVTALESAGPHKTPQPFEIRETYVISDVLNRLVAALPAGCVWLGISRLSAGWDKAADPTFTDFDNTITQQAREKRLFVCRLYCCRGSELPALDGTFRRHRQADIQARLAPEGSPAFDITVIWGPIKPTLWSEVHSSTAPAALLKMHRVAPLCALKFEVIGGSLLKRVEVFPAGAREFPGLAQHFDEHWGLGTVPPESRDARRTVTLLAPDVDAAR